MICLRCGCCCVHFEVLIVDDPAKGISEGNLRHKKSGERCPHLVGSKFGEFSCAVHGRKWYKQTPCHEYTQIERKNYPCRMGKHLRDMGSQVTIRALTRKTCSFCGQELSLDDVWCKNKKCRRGGKQLTVG
jgi:hypothetical protein